MRYIVIHRESSILGTYKAFFLTLWMIDYRFQVSFLPATQDVAAKY